MGAGPEILRELAPSGALRVALNHGNRVLVGRDETGRAQGISVDLAHALGARLGVAPVFVEFDRAVDVAASAGSDVWDVCFLAVDPARAQAVSFTHPYIRIEGCYLVHAESPAREMADISRLNLRIGAVEGSAYALHLARAPGAEGLLPFPTFAQAAAAFNSRHIDGLAGIRQAMEEEAGLRPVARILEPPFMEIRHAMAVPVSRPLAHAHLSKFIADRTLDGTVTTILERHGISGSCALPPGAA